MENVPIRAAMKISSTIRYGCFRTPLPILVNSTKQTISGGSIMYLCPEVNAR